MQQYRAQALLLEHQELAAQPFLRNWQHTTKYYPEVMLPGSLQVAMDPWFRGFKGVIREVPTKSSGKSYVCSGIVNQVGAYNCLTLHRVAEVE
jgi:hypothetical protein